MKQASIHTNSPRSHPPPTRPPTIPGKQTNEPDTATQVSAPSHLLPLEEDVRHPPRHGAVLRHIPSGVREKRQPFDSVRLAAAAASSCSSPAGPSVPSLRSGGPGVAVAAAVGTWRGTGGGGVGGLVDGRPGVGAAQIHAQREEVPDVVVRYVIGGS